MACIMCHSLDESLPQLIWARQTSLQQLPVLPVAHAGRLSEEPGMPLFTHVSHAATAGLAKGGPHPGQLQHAGVWQLCSQTCGPVEAASSRYHFSGGG